MNRLFPVLPFALIAIGVLGLVAAGSLASTPLTPSLWQAFPNGGMMGGPGGMMGGPGGMMGRSGSAPYVAATPVPSNQLVDREIKITARNSQFDPARVVLKNGETIRFTLSNQDPVAHNFVSQDGGISYINLPPNSTQSFVWVAPEKGTYTALCTFHAGMQMQIVVQ